MPDIPGPSHPQSLLAAQLLEQLACPVCRGDLLLSVPDEHIVCAGCARAYPLVDGIPVLIAERATLKA